jgi:hypothetical protein
VGGGKKVKDITYFFSLVKKMEETTPPSVPPTTTWTGILIVRKMDAWFCMIFKEFRLWKK